MIKTAFLRDCFAFLLLLLYCVDANAQVNWIGATSTDWSIGSNWSGGTVPGVSDNVQIGVMHFNFPPALAANTTIRNLTFGGSVQVVLTIQSGATLQVLNKIVQNHGSGDLAPSTLITGAGAISCASVMVGDLTAPRIVQSKTSTLTSKINSFVVTGSIDLNSVTANLLTGGVANNNSLFSLQAGAVMLNGKINTINMLPANCNSFGSSGPKAGFSIDISSDQDALLKLGDTTTINISRINNGSVDFYNHISGSGRSKVEYGGAGELLYTNTIAGIDTSPANYQDLVISGSGVKTAGSNSFGNQLIIDGSLTVNIATLDLKTYNPQTVINGDMTNNGTVTFGAGQTTVKGTLFFTSGTFNTGTGEIHFTGP